MMGLYLAIALIAELTLGTDHTKQSDTRVLTIVWGTALGLAMAHWFSLAMSARAVDQAELTFVVPPVPPLVGGRAGDPHFGGDMCHRSSGFDPEHHCQSAGWREPSVSVHLSPPGSCVGV
jgi:hypothetical protein